MAVAMKEKIVRRGVLIARGRDCVPSHPPHMSASQKISKPVFECFRTPSLCLYERRPRRVRGDDGDDMVGDLFAEDGSEAERL